MIKTKLAALAGTLALTLLMSTVVGAKPNLGNYLPSAAGVQPLPEDGSGAVLGVCPDGSTAFTGQFTGLQTGSPPETNQMTYLFPDPSTGPFEVIVTITVHQDNTFRFDVTGGSIHKIKVKAGLGETLYDYLNYALNPDYDPSEDPPSEERLDQISSDDDLNDRAVRSQAVSHLDFCLSAQTLPPNTDFLGNCFEGADEVPPGQVGEGGCNPSGNQIVEFPNELQGQGFDNETVKQALVPATGQSGSCMGPFVAHDPRLFVSGPNAGEPNPAMRGPLDLSFVFDLTEFFADPLEKVILPEEVIGFPCLAILKGENSVEFVDFFQADVVLDEPVITVTQFADTVPDMFTLPGAGPLSAGQTDMQFVPQASLQFDVKTFHVEDTGGAFTTDVFNPSRTVSGRGTFYFLNTREVCLDVTLATTDPGYPQAVQDCKTDIAVRHFFNLEVAINEANDRGNLISPTVNRLLNLHSKWLSMIKVGRYDESISRGMALRDAVTGGEWIIDEFNDPGHLIMLIDNLLYRSRELEQAELLNGL